MRQVNWQDYIGKPYRPGGQGPDFYDCYGLIRAIAAQLGFVLPEQSTIESVKMREAIFNNEKNPYLIKVMSSRAESRDQDCQPFDLIIFNLYQFGLHIGMMTEQPDRFIHVSELTKYVAIHRLSEPFYKQNIYGFYRLNNPVCLATKAT